MIVIEVYLSGNEMEPLIKTEFPTMVRVGETISILNDYFEYYVVKRYGIE